MSKRDAETSACTPPRPPKAARMPQRKPRSPGPSAESELFNGSGTACSAEGDANPLSLGEGSLLGQEALSLPSAGLAGGEDRDPGPTPAFNPSPAGLPVEFSPGKTGNTAENGADLGEAKAVRDPALLRKISFGKVPGLDTAIVGAAVKCNAVACAHGQKERNWSAVLEEVKVFTQNVPDVAELLSEKKLRDRYRRLYSNLPKMEQQLLAGNCSSEDVELLKILQTARDVQQAEAAKREAERPKRRRMPKKAGGNVAVGPDSKGLNPVAIAPSSLAGVPEVSSKGTVAAVVRTDGKMDESGGAPKTGRATCVAAGGAKKNALTAQESIDALACKVTALGDLVGGDISIPGSTGLEAVNKKPGEAINAMNAVPASLDAPGGHQSQGSLRTELELVKGRLTSIEGKLDQLLAAVLG